MRPIYDYVTFDCYGTLIDWRKGIAEAFVQAAAQDGLSLQPAAVLASYARIEPIVEAGDYRSYREVLRETALRVAQRHDWSLDEAQADFLPRSLADWPPFDDARPALERLRSAGYRIGILSNVDLDLLQQTLDRLDVEFDLLVTAQQVRAYKPDPAHFLEARRSIGSSSWLHAAQSYFHDVMPATELGIPVAWINRHGESPHGEARPDRSLETLEQLADWLTTTA
jgi:2-haloacid dehalogenase/putative hydrolase of the HAD superfamily